MNGSVMRSAIGTAIACGAFVAGPMCVGVALSNAGVLGLGGGGDEINVVGVDVLGGGTKASGNGTAARVELGLHSAKRAQRRHSDETCCSADRLGDRRGGIH